MTVDLSHELREFHTFVQEKLYSDEASELSPEDVLDEWRVLHPTSEELADSVIAVRRAVVDMRAGDRGRPVEDIIADIRQRLLSGSKP